MPTHLTLKAVPPLGLLLTLAIHTHWAHCLLCPGNIPSTSLLCLWGLPHPRGLLGHGPKPPRPKYLPTAPRVSLHHSFHHRTEVCKVLHTLWSQCLEEATA